MIARLATLVFLAVAASAATAQEVARIAYLGVAEDPLYQPQRTYTGALISDLKRPVDGARLAIEGARITGRALGMTFELEEVLLDPEARPEPALRAAFEGGALAVLVDLPEPLFAELVAADRPADSVLLNIRHRGDRWRGADCAADLFHTIPSDSMLSDALAQHLRSRGWDEIALLSGSGPTDTGLAETARRSLGKFGLRIVSDKTFADTNDPRRRDESNLLLLTGERRADVLWLIDSAGDFGRGVPYATFHPTPVVGSQGLRPMAWHAFNDRFGAPQLNQRFERIADRQMTAEDWAAWVAVRAVLEAVKLAATGDGQTIGSLLASDAISLDLYKGVPGSFRSWNRQLRQPILLTTHNAVIAVAPLEGFEHRTNVLDTLGIDQSESLCSLPSPAGRP